MTRLTRAVLEWVLRAVTLAALGTLLWRWTHPAPPASPAPEVADARGGGGPAAIGDALRRWTTSDVPAGHVALAAPPDPATRDWLRALAAAGMRLHWSAARTPALAASAWAVADPVGSVRMDVAAPVGSAMAVGDALAASVDALDTVRVRGAGVSVVAPPGGETLVARLGATGATLAAPRPPRLGAVVVLGRAGWEAKFVSAALEERGWSVRLRVSVAPGLDVTQGVPNALAPDTATTAAVVVLDSSAVDGATAARVARYVRDGGGLVLAGDAATTPALRTLAAGGVGTPEAGVPGAVDGATPERGLALLPVTPLRADAVPLARRGGDVAVAARRVGAGRVVQTGYVETWRWRMAAADEAPAAHRAWWARVVGAAAYAPVPNVPDETVGGRAVSNVRSSTTDPAPLAGAIAALGPPSAAPTTARGRTPTGPRPSDGALATLAGAALLAEVASRRLRGRR